MAKRIISRLYSFSYSLRLGALALAFPLSIAYGIAFLVFLSNLCISIGASDMPAVSLLICDNAKLAGVLVIDFAIASVSDRIIHMIQKRYCR